MRRYFWLLKKETNSHKFSNKLTVSRTVSHICVRAYRLIQTHTTRVFFGTEKNALYFVQPVTFGAENAATHIRDLFMRGCIFGSAFSPRY